MLNKFIVSFQSNQSYFIWPYNDPYNKSLFVDTVQLSVKVFQRLKNPVALPDAVTNSIGDRNRNFDTYLHLNSPFRAIEVILPDLPKLKALHYEPHKTTRRKSNSLST